MDRVKRSVREIRKYSAYTQNHDEAHAQTDQQETPRDPPFARMLRKREWWPGRIGALLQLSAERTSQVPAVIDPSTGLTVPWERICWRHRVLFPAPCSNSFLSLLFSCALVFKRRTCASGYECEHLGTLILPLLRAVGGSREYGTITDTDTTPLGAGRASGLQRALCTRLRADQSRKERIMEQLQHATPVGAKTTFVEVWKFPRDAQRVWLSVWIRHIMTWFSTPHRSTASKLFFNR
jgi:hypothetical protein